MALEDQHKQIFSTDSGKFEPSPGRKGRVHMMFTLLPAQSGDSSSGHAGKTNKYEASVKPYHQSLLTRKPEHRARRKKINEQMSARKRRQATENVGGKPQRTRPRATPQAEVGSSTNNAPNDSATQRGAVPQVSAVSTTSHSSPDHQHRTGTSTLTGPETSALGQSSHPSVTHRGLPPPPLVFGDLDDSVMDQILHGLGREGTSSPSKMSKHVHLQNLISTFVSTKARPQEPSTIHIYAK